MSVVHWEGILVEHRTLNLSLSLSLFCWWLCSFVFLMLLPSPGGYLSEFLIKPLSKMKTLFLGVCNKIAQSLYLILIMNIQIIDFKFVPFAV